MGGPPQKTAWDRVSDKFVIGDGCWPWTAYRNERGYGIVTAGGRSTRRRWRAHRVVYELLVGPVPEGMTLDHECHNLDLTCPGGPSCPHRGCVNPAHLVPRPAVENQKRGVGRVAKPHCPRGHLYDEANTGRTKEGWRYCRACAREKMRRRR